MRIPGIPFVQGRNGYTDTDGKKYGIAIHNTSNNATAAGEADYATRRTDGTSSHFYADRTQVIQSLDTNVRAGHAASKTGNENAVAVEITGTNSKTRAWWLANVDWAELGRVLAVVCKAYGITPRRATVAEMKANPKVRAFYSHNDMRLAWGVTTHDDPGPNFPWDRLFASVKDALDPAPSAPTTQEDDMFTDAEKAELLRLARATNARVLMVAGNDDDVTTTWAANPTAKEANELKLALTALANRDFTDEPAIVVGVLAGLNPAAIAAAVAAALPTDQAEQVIDELRARLAA